MTIPENAEKRKLYNLAVGEVWRGVCDREEAMLYIGIAITPGSEGAFQLLNSPLCMDPAKIVAAFRKMVELIERDGLTVVEFEPQNPEDN